eukprot:gnl/TRDRNA2_/TRDRNA2_152226_c0_seq2.p1 gnl/TRDRNA2_/TRDRNA2_152226_c0~~gnl/TRDRNA2_/TRDRNA2_152226_c0_seq2.p1  ORF type:complete len:518 (+),score=51.26 gnl/TRDRNA2_/TRDRNA2_152226_c0_seq2:2-1555(+)
MIAVMGLSCWSFGLLVFLCWVIKLNAHILRHPTTLRKYAYFYAGFEPNFWWWELLVKRMDTLTILLICYTNLFGDVRAKLFLFMLCSGFWWVVHSSCCPFEDRQNSLLDRLEHLGLSARFVTFSSTVLLLMFGAPLVVSSSVALILLVVNTLFIVSIVFAVVSEVLPLIDKMERKDTGHQTVDRLKHKLHGLFAIVTRFPFMINNEKLSEEKLVPHLEWQGPGCPLQVVSVRRPKVWKRLHWPRKCLRVAISSLYCLGDGTQTDYIASSIGKILQHLLTNAGMKQLPGGPLTDLIAILGLALRRRRNAPTGKSKEKGENAGYDRAELVKHLCQFMGQTSVLGDDPGSDELLNAIIDVAIVWRQRKLDHHDHQEQHSFRRVNSTGEKTIVFEEDDHLVSHPSDHIEGIGMLSGEDLELLVNYLYELRLDEVRRLVTAIHDLFLLMESLDEEKHAATRPSHLPYIDMVKKQSSGIQAEQQDDNMSVDWVPSLEDMPQILSSNQVHVSLWDHDDDDDASI